MKKHLLTYETLLKVSKAISHSKDQEEVILMTVDSIKTALQAKGCTLFLMNRQTNDLEVAASFGLSERYLNKGPLSAFRSIAQTLADGPVAVYDITDDPRIQYPEEACQEGISSILSVPVLASGHIIGALRVYTAEPWEFDMDDISFVQAMAAMAGMAIDIARLYKGMKDSIEILRTMRDPRTIKSRKRTPYEGVPVTVSTPQSVPA